MTTSYPGSTYFSPSISIPSDGDPWNATLLSDPFQELADRTTSLDVRAIDYSTRIGSLETTVTGNTSQIGTLTTAASSAATHLSSLDSTTSGTLSRLATCESGVPGIATTSRIRVPLVPLATTDWVYQSNGLTQGALAGYAAIPLALPATGKLSEIHVILQGIGHSSLPATLPAINVINTHIGSSTVIASTTIASTSDTSTTRAQYDVCHAIVASGLSADLTDPTVSFLVEIHGESGSGAIAASMQILAIWAVVVPA